MARSFTDAFRKAFARITGVQEPKRPKPPSAWERTKKLVGDFRETVKGIGKRLTGNQKAVQQTEFDIAVHDNPAFFSWVNRAGRNLDVKPKPGETLTDARLRAIKKKLGVKSDLELYKLVKEDPRFGFDEYAAAYDKYGKATSSKENPYALNNAIELAFEFDMIANRGGVYETLNATR